MSTLTCPRCFGAIPAEPAVRYCPRCGLPDALRVAGDHQPIDIRNGDNVYRVTDRLAIGSFATLYHCELPYFVGASKHGVIKVARDARANLNLNNEASILKSLSASEGFLEWQAFLPRLIDSFSFSASPGEPVRQVNVFAYESQIKSPDDLRTLQDILTARPGGLDAKDVVWIWRRLLSVLSFSHACGFFHAAVLPEHVLIEPNARKLVLIDWCFAANEAGYSVGAKGRFPSCASTATTRRWFERDGVCRLISPQLDLSLGARCMVFLLGGDPVSSEYPSSVNAAIRRYFDDCIDLPNQSPITAGQLLAEFDQSIELSGGLDLRSANSREDSNNPRLEDEND
jgi:serine/threonine protein kinase